eukprot:jgi/Tetstr1/433920/TSEL_023097.t1
MAETPGSVTGMDSAYLRRSASVSQDSLYDVTHPEYHAGSDTGDSEEDEPVPPTAAASPAIEILETPTPEPGGSPLQVDPAIRRGWGPNCENFDEWFSVWPDPELLHGEDYGNLHHVMRKWLRDWEFDKFDIEYQYAFLEGFLRLCPAPPGVQFRFCRRAFAFVVCREFWRGRVARAFDRPPPLRVESPELRQFALVWMPWFMVTGLGLGPFEGPLRRGKMSFLRCLIDIVPWDLFPPGAGMSWWGAEQISRSLDLAGPSDPPSRLFDAELQPPSTGAPPVAKTPGAEAGPSHAPPRVSAAELQPPSTGAPPVGKTPSAKAGPSDAPNRVSAAELQPPSTGAPPVGKTPSAKAGPSDPPSRLFDAELQPPSTGAPPVGKTTSAKAGPSDAPPRVSAAELQPPSTGAPPVGKV